MKNNNYSNFSLYQNASKAVNFSTQMNNPEAVNALFNNTNTSKALQAEHAAFMARKEAYDKWAQNTKLVDAISPLTNRPFAELLKFEVGEYNQTVMVFNPEGAVNGVSYDTNTYGVVNAVLQ